MGHIAPAPQPQSETGNTDAVSMLTGVLSSVASNNNARKRRITPRMITQEQISNARAFEGIFSARYASGIRLARGMTHPRVYLQDRRTISGKSFFFNPASERKGFSRQFGSGTMCDNVAPHAWSPPNFPHTEKEAKVMYAPWQGSLNGHASFTEAQKPNCVPCSSWVMPHLPRGPTRFLLPVPNNSAVSQEKVRLAATFPPDGWLQCRLIPCVYMKTPGR